MKIKLEFGHIEIEKDYELMCVRLMLVERRDGVITGVAAKLSKVDALAIADALTRAAETAV